MTAKSIQNLARASISADDLLERFKIACDLKQPVDHEKIRRALARWADRVGCGDVAIKFVTTGEQVEEAAWAARDAWAARAVRAAWAAWAARDVSYVSIAAIGAPSGGEENELQKWLPVLEAFEAGAFALWIGAETFYVAVIPTVVRVDEQRRLHCVDGPAFAWLDDIREFYWQGVNVPETWIMNPSGIKAETALSEQNMERRRAACSLIPGGWETILKTLEAKTIDRDGDPQIGELVEFKLPGEGKKRLTARYLRVQCGTGRKFAVCVPPETKTALDAQAWMLGLVKDRLHATRNSHLTRRRPMKCFTKIAAQGEITVIRLGPVPENKKLSGTEMKAESGKFIVGHSETGHHHVIGAEGNSVTVMEKPPEGMRILRAILENPTSLDHLRDHDTHESIMLEPGLYEFRIGREYDPYQEIARRQAD